MNYKLKIMENKNKVFTCQGNEEADNLLCMIENSYVLSEHFIEKVTRIVLVILSNLENNEEFVEQEIDKLKEEMQWLTIFSEKFIDRIIGQLLLSFEKQKTLNKNGK